VTEPRESHLVELVDTDGSPTGVTTVDEAHRSPGQLHRAFSVFLIDAAGRVLLQQRAAITTRFPMRWANTCCGHPEPGEEATDAAARRLVEEIGVGDVALVEVGVYSYYAEDPATGRVEYEYDHVLLGELPGNRKVLPDPREVAAVRWMTPDELQDRVVADSRAYAPWLAGVTQRLLDHLRSDDASERSGGQ
jgi:isopentenyl-diphosphate delta-isomerase